jgi:hypothetical protein
VQDETGVPQKVMDDVAIRDTFSFITVSKDDGFKIVDAFNAKAK